MRMIFFCKTSHWKAISATAAAALLTQSGCKTWSENQPNSPQSLQLQELTSAEKTPNSNLSEQLIKLLPESLQAVDQFENSTLGQRLKTLMGRDLSTENKQTLISLRALLVAQREIREQRPAQARELARVILSTDKLSTEIYISALRKLTLADVIELSQSVPDETQTGLPRNPRSEFNSFQNLQCAVACQTLGWAVLAREESTLLNVQGYRSKLLSDAHFRRENLKIPSWLRNIFSQSTTASKKEIIFDSPQRKNDTELEQVLALRTLVDTRQWSAATLLAKKIIASKKLLFTSYVKQKSACPADVIYAQYVNAQNARIQQDRKAFASYQTLLMDVIDKSSCSPKDFGFDVEQFDSFRLDARLWLARLQWEQGENAKAFHTARMALNEATSLQSWEHFADAAKILVGRIGFEILSPTENVTILSFLENQPHANELEDFPSWIHSRMGLLHFLEGDFNNSKKSFAKAIDSATDNLTRSMAFYWMGRTTLANNEFPESENAFLSSGLTDPLSIYDIFSGQLLARESGRASTQAKRAFLNHWHESYDSWMQFSFEKPLKIFSTAAQSEIGVLKPHSPNELTLSREQFDISLENALLIFSLLKAMVPEMEREAFLRKLRASDDLLPHILRAEVAGLRQAFTRLNTLHSEVLPRAHQIAWLTHMLGDYANAILFVGRLRDSLGWDSDYLPFLYFIFYPRPFLDEFNNAAARCSVDVDVLYSIARQESLFQSSVKSPVGAVGLMQLLPTTAQRILKQLPEFQNGQRIDLTDPYTNTLAGACYLRDLLTRYNNNLAHAVAAYNAGENIVDKWISRRQKINDVPYFIEFIPFAETKTYVQRVMRNYYNIKWIYQEPPKK